MATPEEIRQQWKEEAQRGLPAPGLVRERNQAITARYAGFYLDCQALFKWAGMAVFASHQVGEALLPYDFSLLEGGVPNWKDPKRELPLPPRLVQELELLRTTNNKVYDDIAWAHLAYRAPAGGLAVVEAGLADLSTHQRMLDGFRNIDEGRELLKGNALAQMQGISRIWLGNQLLLEHEQTVMVQPAFEELGPKFEFVLSESTHLKFDAEEFNVFTRYQTSFWLFMFTRGVLFLLRTLSLPEIRSLDQRWYWIQKRVLRIWKYLDGKPDKARDSVLAKAPEAAATGSSATSA
jgi:hypothetical protein